MLACWQTDFHVYSVVLKKHPCSLAITLLSYFVKCIKLFLVQYTSADHWVIWVALVRHITNILKSLLSATYSPSCNYSHGPISKNKNTNYYVTKIAPLVVNNQLEIHLKQCTNCKTSYGYGICVCLCDVGDVIHLGLMRGEG